MGSNLNLHLLGQFCEDNELWINYKEWLEEFITLNDVAENLKVSVLIACIGPKCYGLLKDLIAPAKPKSKTYTDLTKVLSDHFCPQPHKFAERYKFEKRNQLPGETVNDYVAAIRKLSTHCAYGAFLDEALTQRLVCGIACISTQKRLQVEQDLTLNKAVEIANSFE